MDIQSFIGRQETSIDHADAARIARLAATIGDAPPPRAPNVMPPLGHWLCFQPDTRMSLLGIDGHPLRTADGLLPDIDLPRRMWAGSRIRFIHGIPIGAAISRTSTLLSATAKQGRSGEMLFVTVRHDISVVDGPVAITEEQDIVFRGASARDAVAVAASPVRSFQETDDIVTTVVPDTIMLFRYSALTFNSHRIHYDRDYARDIEGYRGLVVQGPLMATLLLHHLSRHQPERRVSSFTFRAISPLFDGEAVTLGLKLEVSSAQLRAIGPAGVAMTAAADF